MANTKIHLIEKPINSNVYFQMLLYYHSYYDILYAVVLLPTGVYKMFIGNMAGNPNLIVSFVLTFLYSLTEVFRINFGYKGNIDESFPELLAFLLQTILFSLSFTIFPVFNEFLLPHELSMYFINFFFLATEFIVGLVVIHDSLNILAGAFHRTTAPLLDGKFSKKYEAEGENIVGTNK